MAHHACQCCVPLEIAVGVRGPLGPAPSGALWRPLALGAACKGGDTRPKSHWAILYNSMGMGGRHMAHHACQCCVPLEIAVGVRGPLGPAPSGALWRPLALGAACKGGDTRPKSHCGWTKVRVKPGMH